MYLRIAGKRGGDIQRRLDLSAIVLESRTFKMDSEMMYRRQFVVVEKDQEV